MASGKVPAVLALATGLAVAGVLGLAPVCALFAGLSNAGLITVAGMLLIAKGVVKTGAIARVTWRLVATVTSAAQALRRLIVASGLMRRRRSPASQPMMHGLPPRAPAPSYRRSPADTRSLSVSSRSPSCS
jgi:hypothetical protein